MIAEEKVNILLVDDRAAQRLSLAAALAQLGENLVEAASGRDALRALLRQQFAVILLDVNMPGLDGFETAALIRQRESSEHTPIIFLTAYADDTYALRGYSLGAVDYILAPVEPQVLRTKVAFFVELFKKNEEVKRQAASLRQRAAQLHRLTEAALAINSELSIERILHVVTEQAAAIIGAHQVVTSTASNLDGIGGQRIILLSDTYADWRGRPIELASLDLQWVANAANPSMRMIASELDAQQGQHWPHQRPADHLPMRGWLVAPLTGRQGPSLGVIQLSDKRDGEFTDDDEAILVQLAQMASIAIENAIYSQEREANRVKDEFLATLSHELRTPLQAMLTWAHVLRANNVDPATVARGLDVIHRSGQAQARLIEDLLDVSRIINNKLSIELIPVDIVRVVDAAIDAVRPGALAADINVERAAGPSSCAVRADPNRLQQIIGNLLSNAVKFTPKGGRVGVHVEQDGRHARIRVSDTGKGIPAHFLPHIFERFRQADSSPARAHGGLGIGLFVVRRLAELHGGTVRAESAGEGNGSTFTVELPLIGVGSRPHATAPIAEVDGGAPLLPAANGLRLDGVRLVVVDDEDDARECMKLALQHYGARVTAVGSAAAAVAAIDEALPDALVCDLGMPGEDGFSLMRRIRARPPERGGLVPAAAVTAYARSEDRARALAAGFDAHVPKPVEPIDLASAVKNLLRKSVRP
jgi:signal transduction histidine kinase